MPTYRTPEPLLRRAIESVLAQDIPLRLVVVNDGGLPSTAYNDRRVTVVDLPANRGRFFCDAAVLEACGTEWFAVHDADDWSEPHRYGRLIDTATSGATVAPHVEHGRTTTVRHPKQTRRDRQFRHIAHWGTGVYRTDRLRDAGGIHPGFRVGYDTLLLLMLTLTGPVAAHRQPTYHYDRRNSTSLTRAPATGKRSGLRADTAARLRSLYQDAWQADDPGTVVRDDIPASLRAEVSDAADLIRERM